MAASVRITARGDSHHAVVPERDAPGHGQWCGGREEGQHASPDIPSGSPLRARNESQYPSFSRPPKVIFLDLKLPKVDGLQILTAIKTDPRTRAIPVVIMTSSAEQRDLIDSYRTGVNAFIQKPVDFEEFRKVIEHVGIFWLAVNKAPPPEVFRPASMSTVPVLTGNAVDLAQMEGRYRGLLEAAPDAMVVVNQDGEIVLLNVQAEKQFGYPPRRAVGQQVKSIIPEGFAERLIADGTRSVDEALAQQIGTGIELIGRRKNGSKFPIEIMLSPLESAEGILVTAAIRDISVRKAAEQHLAQMEGRIAACSRRRRMRWSS